MRLIIVSLVAAVGAGCLRPGRVEPDDGGQASRAALALRR